jgi:hypothetical protein
VNDGWQLVWQLWEFRPDTAAERCVQSGTLPLGSTEPGIQAHRLDDARTAVVYWHDEEPFFTLTLRQVGCPDSTPPEYQVKTPGYVKWTQLLTGCRELLVVTEDTAHVVDISSGEILRQVGLSFDYKDVYLTLGSTCLFTGEDLDDRHLMDMQAGREIVLSDRLCPSFGTLSWPYGFLCAEAVNQNELVLIGWLDWQQQG